MPQPLRAPVLTTLAPGNRVTQRKRVAALLRMVRKTARTAEVCVMSPEDSFQLALWWLGAFRRNALQGGIWVNRTTGWPVVRDPATLQYLTVDIERPLGDRTPLPYPRLQHVVASDEAFLVQ